MEKLINYLLEKGIVIGEQVQALVLKDAIIYLHKDKFGNNVVDVEPIDAIHSADDSVEDVLSFNVSDFLDKVATSEIDEEDWEDYPDYDDDDDDDDDDDYYEEDEPVENNKFNIGSVVSVNGYEGEAYEVIKYSHERIFEDGKMFEEIMYILQNLKTDDYLEAFEGDMTLYKTKSKKEGAKLLGGGMLKIVVDQLLDEYNDYMELYKAFGDTQYKERADKIMEELKKVKL